METRDAIELGASALAIVRGMADAGHCEPDWLAEIGGVDALRTAQSILAELHQGEHKLPKVKLDVHPVVIDATIEDKE